MYADENNNKQYDIDLKFTTTKSYSRKSFLLKIYFLRKFPK